ncbi:RDD family protein [Oceanobacillus piezotolerans]|uniref:RDD family protein n=1 Tax=Oceanobacillus piezotolerans TaxID=2448030 RepID=A0A498D9G5_9BACI|nr:RDD family protein [Oceanobacillus piezotolerans]RLL45457.1 RDD family protein [Oceanobacillus piezotolerans]
MKDLTKKRTKAVMIDGVVSGILSLGVEYFLRKKVKNEFVHTVVTPTVVMWSLEYAQMRTCGQTVGYKAMGLALESKDGKDLNSCQIVKRIAYRDTLSTLDYFKDREAFEGENGAAMPHDRYTGTVVREK